jgi:hypothetical protein
VEKVLDLGGVSLNREILRQITCLGGAEGYILDWCACECSFFARDKITYYPISIIW